MKIKIESEKKNPLLKRTDVVALVDHEGGPTPSKEEIRKKLSAEKDWDLNKIEIKYIHSVYGSPFSKTIIKIWDKPQERLMPKEGKVEEGKEAKEETKEKKEKVEESKGKEQKEEKKEERKEQETETKNGE